LYVPTNDYGIPILRVCGETHVLGIWSGFFLKNCPMSFYRVSERNHRIKLYQVIREQEKQLSWLWEQHKHLDIDKERIYRHQTLHDIRKKQAMLSRRKAGDWRHSLFYLDSVKRLDLEVHTHLSAHEAALLIQSWWRRITGKIQRNNFLFVSIQQTKIIQKEKHEHKRALRTLAVLEAEFAVSVILDNVMLSIENNNREKLLVNNSETNSNLPVNMFQKITSLFS